MQSAHAHVNSISALATGNGNDATPFSQQRVRRTKQASLARTWQAHDWQAQPARSVERDAALTAHVASRAATIRDLTQRLSGTTREPSAGPEDAAASTPSRPRPRGHQPGSTGQGRRERAALLVVPAGPDVCAEAPHGPAWGAAFLAFPGAEESRMRAVQVQAPRRRIPRRRSPQAGPCPQGPGMVPAPPAPRGLPQSPRGGSRWTPVRLDTDR